MVAVVGSKPSPEAPERSARGGGAGERHFGITAHRLIRTKLLTAPSPAPGLRGAAAQLPAQRVAPCPVPGAQCPPQPRVPWTIPPRFPAAGRTVWVGDGSRVALRDVSAPFAPAHSSPGRWVPPAPRSSGTGPSACRQRTGSPPGGPAGLTPAPRVRPPLLLTAYPVLGSSQQYVNCKIYCIVFNH